MHRLLLGIALIAALTSPAMSKAFPGAAFSASVALVHPSVRTAGGVRIHRLAGVVAEDRHGRRYARRTFSYAYPFDAYDADYDIDRSWDEDSFNDWWHDRPDRAYPRWVWHNRGCSEDRMWWSGAGWRCTP